MPGGASIGWNENSPADGDAVGSGDDEIRSLKTALRQGLASEHAWPSAGGLSGYHTLGSARVYTGAQSLVSSDGTDGRLMLASDSSNFFALQSTGTVFAGGARTLSMGSYPGTTPQRHQWILETGVAQTVSGVTTVTFPNSGYSGIPFVTFGASDPLSGMLAGVMYTSISATAFSVVQRDQTGAVSDGAFTWMSVGTRVL